MPRNSSGIYTLPAGNPVVTATTIASAWANGTFTDVATEVTNSLDRSGRGGMLAFLRGVDGTVAAPAFSFTAEIGTGFYRQAVGSIGFASQGTNYGNLTTNGWQGNVLGNLTGNVTGTVTGHSTLDLPLTGGALSGAIITTLSGYAFTGMPAAATGFSGFKASDSGGNRKLEVLFFDSGSGGGYGVTAGQPVINAQGGFLGISTADVLRFAFDSAGRVYGTSLHNNGSSPTGTTNQYIASGTYTPTLTNTTNVSASTPRVGRWIRVGNVVYVNGHADVTATGAGGVQTVMGISLPIVSVLAAVTDLDGVATANLLAGGVAQGVGQFGDIEGNVGSARATLFYNSSTTSNVTFKYSFSYTVL